MRREICVSKLIGLACIRGQIPSTRPPGSSYSEGRFNGGFFALRFRGAYIRRGLYMEGLFFRNFTVTINFMRPRGLHIKEACKYSCLKTAP